ncbi:MAG: transporter related protein [Actinomycetia bacterium]|nr:transporter related protein [Actinomycetes bacterium]
MLDQDLPDLRLIRPAETDTERVVTYGEATTESSGDLTGVGALLKLEAITVTFGGITALDGIDLRVDRGEVVGIIGPNGAGKTTLFDVVSGVRVPSRGTVLLGGTDVTRRPPASRARLGLRRTFQRVQVFGWLSVEDNVLAALDVVGGGGGFVADLVGSPFRRHRERERRHRGEATLERCGLSDVRHELAGSLPIGIARMVELARAIVDPPRLLLLDEPASGLDSQESERLGREIRSLREESACSVLLVEHDAGFVMEQCDRIVVLDQGAILAQGLPDEIQRDAAVRSAYLGAPTDDRSDAAG